MERRKNWILRDADAINGSEILNKYQSSFMFILVVLFFMVRMNVLQGLLQGIIRPGALNSFLLA